MSVRIPYDSLTLRAVAHELAHTLEGGAIQQVSQPVPTDLVLTVRCRGANHALLLSCDATHARAHLTSVKRANPASAPSFCMLCRKYIGGARIRSVRQRGFDRILDIDIEDAEGTQFRLVAELMGKHSNLILVSNRQILDSAKHVSKRLSSFRETLPGYRYVAPPAQEDRADSFAATAEELAAYAAEMGADREAEAARLMAHFSGLSPFLAAELLARAARTSLPEAWDALFGAAQRGEWSPVVVRNERGDVCGAYPFPTVQYPAEAQQSRDMVNTALDQYYTLALPRAEMDAAVRELTTAVDRAIKAKVKLRESLDRSLREAGRAEEHKQSGELLLANLYAITEKSESVEVTDYYAEGAPSRVIPLDPLKTARENADLYFRRYRKARDGVEIQRVQLDRTETELATLRLAKARLTETKELREIRALRAELVKADLLRRDQEVDLKPGQKPARPDFGGKKIRVYSTPEGWDIYLGETAEANDYLTTRVSAPSDIWLHVRANTSAHVVIRTRNNPTAVPQSVLQRAAVLAAQHSAAKHSSVVPVDYVLRKHVRRPRGAAPGMVTYQNEKTLFVNPTE